MSERSTHPTGERARLQVLRGGGQVSECDDATLFLRVGDGDAEAFTELFRRHQDVIYRLVRRFARGPDDARDLTQRAFLRALEVARRGVLVRPGREFQFRAWLVRVAVNLAKNHLRDERRRNKVPLTLVQDASSEPSSAHQALEQEEVRRQMRQVISQLPRRQREVFLLRIDGDLPFAEIATTLGITENNAKVHFHHAFKRVRSLVLAARTES